MKTKQKTVKPDWHTTVVTSSVDVPSGSKEHHKQELLKVLEEKDSSDGLRIGLIMEEYEDKVNTPRSKKSVRRYLLELVDEDKVVWRGKTNTRKYRKK